MTVGQVSRGVASIAALAVLTLGGAGWLWPAVAHGVTPDAVQLSGHAVGDVLFGTAQAEAQTELTAMFGSLKTHNYQARDLCGLSAVSTGKDVVFNFEKRRLVGYTIGNGSGKMSGLPDVTTAAGLRLGDTISQARKMYGRRFVTSGAQGGSWAVKTATGNLVGMLVAPPMTGSNDRIDLIGAGDFGCPAMAP